VHHRSPCLLTAVLLLPLLPSVAPHFQIVLYNRYFPTGGYLNSKQGDGSGWVSTKDWLDMLHGRKARPSKNNNNSNNNNNNRNNNAPKPAPARPAAPRPAPATAPAPAPAVAAAPARNSFFPFFGFFG
jgi:hypothetical protein